MGTSSAPTLPFAPGSRPRLHTVANLPRSRENSSRRELLRGNLPLCNSAEAGPDPRVWHWGTYHPNNAYAGTWGGWEGRNQGAQIASGAMGLGPEGAATTPTKKQRRAEVELRHRQAACLPLGRSGEGKGVTTTLPQKKSKTWGWRVYIIQAVPTAAGRRGQFVSARRVGTSLTREERQRGQQMKRRQVATPVARMIFLGPWGYRAPRFRTSGGGWCGSSIARAWSQQFQNPVISRLVTGCEVHDVV